MKSFSAHEGTLWSSLIITVAASVYFFGEVFGAMAAGDPMAAGEIAKLGLALVVILVATEIALNIVVTIACRGEPQLDERDRIIATKAARNAYYILITGLFMVIGHAGIYALLGYAPAIEFNATNTVIFLVFALVVAEIAHFISRIVYYRLGS